MCIKVLLDKIILWTAFGHSHRFEPFAGPPLIFDNDGMADSTRPLLGATALKLGYGALTLHSKSALSPVRQSSEASTVDWNEHFGGASAFVWPKI
jgi:hypothetical protein